MKREDRLLLGKNFLGASPERNAKLLKKIETSARKEWGKKYLFILFDQERIPCCVEREKEISKASVQLKSHELQKTARLSEGGFFHLKGRMQKKG